MAVKEHKKPSVEINNLRFTYPGIDGYPPPGSTPLIDDFSLTLYPGDRCLLVGSNGEGRLQILKILGGKHMVEPDRSECLEFHDTALTASGDLKYLGGEWRREVAFAGFEVPIKMDVSAETMIFGVSGTDPKRRDELIKVLGIDLSWRMHKSSDGQRRRVQICMGLLKPFKPCVNVQYEKSTWRCMPPNGAARRHMDVFNHNYYLLTPNAIRYKFWPVKHLRMTVSHCPCNRYMHACIYICCHNQSEINSYNFVTKEKDRMAPEVGSGTKKAQEGIELGKPSYGYVTFLAGNGDYVKGVVGLAKGLIKASSMYPLVVAILPDVPEEHRMLLRRYGCIVREIEPLAPSLQSSDKYARSYYVLNYSKLRIWQFVEYSKMVYLDGDMQVFENIDHLFELPDKYLYAVADCICDMYGEPCPEVLPWPEVLGPRPSIYFNAGMFVFQPNLSIYVHLLNTLKVTPPTQFAEQDFLNMHFKDKYKPIPYVYNLLLAMLWRHPEKVEVNKAKVVHYCFPGAKPWKYTGKEEHMDREDIKMLVKKWWDIYNDTTLDHKAQGSGVEANRLKASAFSDSDTSNLCY